VGGVQIVSGDGVTPLAPPSIEVVRAVLADVVAVWWRVRRQPVMLVPAFSREIATYAAQDPAATPVEVVQACTEHWFEKEDSKGAMDDRASRSLFGSLTERDLDARADELLEVATAAWKPMLVALGKVT
jgi:exonuclease V gamma subunit